MMMGIQVFAPIHRPIAAEGGWNNTLNCAVVAGPIDPLTPANWMIPSAQNPLRFNVSGVAGVTFVPYFEITDDSEVFTAYPIMVGTEAAAR